MRKVAMVVGRFQPPTAGHEALVDNMREYARLHDMEPMLFISDGAGTSLDLKVNPLDGLFRERLLKRWFPDIRVDLVSSAFEAIEVLDLQGRVPGVWFAGSDRIRKYQGVLDYAGYKARAVEVDRTTGKTAGVSGTMARQYAVAGDSKSFRSVMPSMATPEELAEIMSRIRRGQGMHEL